MIQWVMKRDGRKLDHQTLETIRFMAVERVREGEAPSAVIASYGFSRTSIYKWLAAVSKPGVGVRALASRPAPGRPRRLTAGQEQKVFAGSMAMIPVSMAWISAYGPDRWCLT